VSGVSRWRESPNLERAVETAGGPEAFAAAVSAMLDDARGWRLAEMRRRRGMTQEQRRDTHEYCEGYAEAQRAYLIGQAVRDRRLALGLSQVELAARAGMTQPALSRLEAGSVIPTIPLLERISAALDADLIVQIAPHAA